MTTETTLTREDTGSFAAVRPVDPDQPVSAPYSRAVGLLERWSRDARRTADEFSAWIEGQAAQAAAEMRAMCDELELPQVQPTSVQWAELPEADPQAVDPEWLDGLSKVRVRETPLLLSDRDTTLDAMVRHHRPIGGWTPPPRPIEDFAPAPDENMPGRVTRLTPRDNPLAVAYREREARGWKPDPADYGPHPAEPDHGPIDRWLMRVEQWWRRKQAERDERMGVTG